MIRCIDIEDMRAKIQAAEDDKNRIEEEQDRFSEKADDIAGQQANLQQEYIQVCADLKSSDLGSKKRISLGSLRREVSCLPTTAVSGLKSQTD